MDMHKELHMTLPGGNVPTRLTMMLWMAGVTPWSYAEQCGPDFLPRYPMEQLVTWAAYSAYKKLEHDNALLDAMQAGKALLEEQGYTVAEEVINAE